MPSEGSVSQWLGALREGEGEAVERIWQRYFHRLVGLARTKLGTSPRRVADEEDVALSAFDSFCRRAEQGQFPQLLDRDGLWRLLVVITSRKAARLKRDEGRVKRGGQATFETSGEDDPSLEQVLGREPTPEMAAEMAEQYRLLLGVLGDRELESVAVWRMEGHSVEEIAQRLNCAPRSVKRKLQLIRSLWEEQVGA